MSDVELITLALLIISSYLIGLVSMLMLIRYVKDRKYKREERYRGIFKEYEKGLSDIITRLNIIEARLDQIAKSQRISQEYHITRETKASIEGIEKRILSLLLEGSKTSREIEASIDRTREHTARLMKRLYEQGYVTRDTSNKPYKYSITDKGRRIINASPL